MGAIGVGVRFQCVTLRDDVHGLQALVTTPVFAFLLLSVYEHAGRPDLDSRAVVTTGLMGMWTVAVACSGQIVAHERALGTLEHLLTAPTRFALVVLGRSFVVALVGCVGVIESAVVARVLFDSQLAMGSLGLALLTLGLAVVTTAAASTLVAALFVLSRTTRVYQAALTYPVFLLGGLMVPVTEYAPWLQVACRGFYLSWLAELAHGSLNSMSWGDAVLPAGATAVLGLLMWATGHRLLAAFIERGRVTGALAHA